MAWTRAGQIGMEHATTAEWTINGATQPVVSSTKAKTGTYSMRHATNTSPAGIVYTNVSQVRAGAWLNHGGAVSNRSPFIFSWSGSGGAEDRVQWDENNSILELVIDGVVEDTVADTTGGFSNTDNWIHCGVVINSDSVSGWVSFYLDGVQVMATDSKDTGTVTGAVYLGGFSSIAGWLNFAYFDDMYADTSDGSEVDSFVPLKIFDFRIANANGTTSDMDGSDGNKVNNFELVDDVPPDDDTTYVFATATGTQDSYNTSALSVPSGFAISAEIASVLARKTGSAEQLKVGFYDGATTDLSAAKDLTASYSVIWERFTAQPDSTDWNETDGDAMEVVIESAGTF